MAKNISTYLSQLETLTRKNLDILQAINDSFFTKREHLTVNVGDAHYVIPSFISLENKINSLQENFNNIINAPKTGEATFNFDGNSRSIEVKGYTCTPNRLTLDAGAIKGFGVEQNDILKDILTPNPYINFSLQSLPNDITQVNIRKVAMKSDTLKSVASRLFGGESKINYEWSDLWKILSIYREDEDYVMYDTIRRLPIRKNIGSGEYIIKSIDKDVIDSNLDEYITLTLKEDLKYKLFDETIEKYLAPGDCLVTYDDSAKMEIVSVNPANRSIVVKVLNGDYLNLVADAGDETLVSEWSKLKFFSPVDYNKDKYINVPLEEDRYVFIFVAPLNDRMNVQAPWGSGVGLDTEQIVSEADGVTTYKTYYDKNIRNIGDILYEISTIMTNPIMKYSKDEFQRFANYKPYVNPEHLQVVQINTHLNNSPVVQNIRALYSQKQQYNKELVEVQQKISDINDVLASISFSGTTGVRDSHMSQLKQYNIRKNELMTSITKVIQEISVAANDSVIPLENAKYHIRGYYDWNNQGDEVLKEFGPHVHGIKVQYRYKTKDVAQGNAKSIGNKFIFSDWNEMPGFILKKNPSYKDKYTFDYPQFNGTQDNGNQNEPSFNQIDIPITQGETVDIRLKVIWDFGYPFIETTSQWSEITNIQFPDELLKDVQILDIVSENNNDIETNRFNNILIENGVSRHVDDSVNDQDVTFFHKPENIASGFYTSERRIIPLRDKLQNIDASIKNLDAIINGASTDNLQVSIILEGMESIIKPGQINTVILPPYGGTEADQGDDIYTTIATIQIANISSYTSYLFSMFPGTRSIILNKLEEHKCKFKKEDYCKGTNQGVWLFWPKFNENSSSENNGSNNGSKNNHNGTTEGTGSTGTGTGSGDSGTTTGTGSLIGDYEQSLQTPNQWLTFRIKDAYNGEKYYETGDQFEKDNKLSLDNKYQVLTDNGTQESLTIYPYLSERSALQLDGDDVYGRLVLAPNEAVVVPMVVQYKIEANKYKSKTISFDIRPSLFSDPTNYVVKFDGANADTIQQKSSRESNKRLLSRTMLTETSASNSASTLQAQQEVTAKSRYQPVIKNQ